MVKGDEKDMLNEKHIIITGAAGGIAEPTIKRLHSAGCRLHLIDIEEERLASVAAGFEGATYAVSTLETPEACRAALPKGDDQINGVVHLAGIFVAHGLSDRAIYDATLAANATNAFDLLGVLEPRLADGGSVVLVSSLAFMSGAADHPAYSMSKGAIVGLTRSLSKKWGPKGVRVNALAPGIIDTAMPADIIAERGEALLARTPLGRFGSADDVAGPIEFFLSDASSFITGQTIAVDGGIVNR
ncbi:MAG: SDR family oxidoreductase [Paracoccaceae bacterium]|nr:SDR family oxidoreductase [Paracoccaceae bacterium]